MARPNWEYIRVDVLLPVNSKLDGLSAAAKWTLIELWAYCGQHLTDGFVRDAMWRKIGTPASRKAIAATSLAERVEGGWLMHDYLDHQRSRAEVVDLREKRRKAGEKGGRAKANGKQVLEHLPEQNVSKALAEAEAEAEAEVLTADVDQSSADSNARAASSIENSVIDLLADRGHVISSDQAAAIAARILTGRQPGNPLGYVRYVIQNEPDPVRRFLTGPTSEAGRLPSARPVAEVLALEPGHQPADAAPYAQAVREQIRKRP